MNFYIYKTKNAMKKSILGLIFIVFASNLHCEAFTSLSWSGGGAFTSIEYSPLDNQTIFASSDVAGIWKSNNLGESWSPFNKGLTQYGITQLHFSKYDPQSLYAVSTNGVFLSKNSEEWKLISPNYKTRRNINFEPLSSSSISEHKLCLGDFDGKIHCFNAIDNKWIALRDSPSIGPVSRVKFNIKENMIYTTQGTYLNEYSFSNHKWNMTKFNAIIYDFIEISNNRLLMAVGKELLIYDLKTQISTLIYNIKEGEINKLSINNQEAQLSEIVITIKEGWHGQITKLYKQEEQWLNKIVNKTNYDDTQPYRTWRNTVSRTLSLSRHPTEKNIIFVTDYWGIFKSIDNGVTWKESVNGAVNTVATDFILDSQNRPIIATMDNGLVRLEPAGSFTTLFPKNNKKDKNYAGHVWQIATKDNSKSIVASLSPWNIEKDFILISNDYGETFTIKSNGLPPKRPKNKTIWEKGYIRALSYSPSGKLYLGLDGEENGGIYEYQAGKRHKNNFNLLKKQPDSKAIYNGLVVNPNNPAHIIWGTCKHKQGVYESVNYGKDWKQTLNKLCIFDIQIQPDGFVYALGNNKKPVVYRKSLKDNGYWNIYTKTTLGSTFKAVATNPKDNDEIFLGSLNWSNKGTPPQLLSFNNGRTWNNISCHLPAQMGVVKALFDNKGEYLYLLLRVGGLIKLRTSSLEQCINIK